MPRRPLQPDLFGRRRALAGPAAAPLPLPPGERWRRILRRRGWLLALTLLLALVAGGTVVRCRQPWYAAHAQVEVQPPTPPADTGIPPAPLSPADTAAVATVAEELGSPANVDSALQLLPPEQSAALLPPPLRSPLWLRRAWLRLWPLPTDAAARTAAALRHLSVSVTDNSRLLALQYTAPSPELATGFLRRLTQAYLDSAGARQQAAAQRRVSDLQAQGEAARLRIAADAARLDQLARAQGLSDPAAQLAAAGQRWQQLTSAETTAEVEAARQSAALSRPSANPADLPSDLLVKRAQAAAEVRRLAAIYQPEAAPLRQAEQQLAGLEAGVRLLLQQERDARQQSLAAVQQETAALRRRIAGQAGDQADLQRRLAAFDLAQRPLQAERTGYSHLLDRLQDAVAAGGDTAAPIVITAPATAAPQALSPRLAPALAAALLAGLVIGLAVCAGWDNADDRLRWPEAEEMGVELAAALPALDETDEYAGPEMAQALERCAAALLRAQTDVGLRTVLICSPGRGEGKTTLASQLAGQLVQSGLTVLLLDGHHRRPCTQGAPGAARLPGLAELLSGEATMEAVLQPQVTSEGRPAFIPAGSSVAGACLPLANGAVADLLTAAHARFDWVLVDGPCAGEGPEAGLWAGITDSTWIVARYRGTRRAELRQTIADLTAAGAAHLALVVNRAPVGSLSPGHPLWHAQTSVAAAPVATLRARA